MAKRRLPSLAGLRVAVIGTGKAGSAFAVALSARGARVTTWSRTSPRSRSPSAAALDAEVVLICVRDDAIAAVANRLAAEWTPGRRRAPVALHLSGYHGAQPLQALARKGWATGSLHPLAPMTGRSSAALLQGAWFATSARGRAATMVGRIVSGLSGMEFPLRGGDARKPAWHLACALVANGSVALFDMALEHAGPEAAPALASVLGRIAGRLERGPKAALTGPVARGEEEVVAGHLAILRRRADQAELYRLLSRRLLALSELPARERRAMARLLR